MRKTITAAILALCAGYTLRALQELPIHFQEPPPLTAEEHIRAGITDLLNVPEADESDVADIIAETWSAIREGKQL